MTHTLDTKFHIDSWDEAPYEELEDGRKLARAHVQLSGPADGLTSASFDALLYYGPDGTSSYVSLMQAGGSIGGRTGSFVLQGRGTYDGTTASGESVVIEGSGSGQLATLRGTSVSVSTHADYPFMPFVLRYELG